MKKECLLIFLAAFVISANAAYVENFDGFSTGVLTAQAGWEGQVNFTVAETTDSGLYVGGRALQSTTYTDKTARTIETGISLDLNPSTSNGLEFGFDVREDTTTLANARMYLRQGATATYSPSFGFSAGVASIRPVGESGTTINGNNLSSAAFYGEGTEADPGYWVKGEWIRFKIVLTGENFDFATVYAYNLSRGGIEIPTGLENVQLSVNPQSKVSSYNRVNVRGGSTSTYIDNVYVTDYVVPEPATIAILAFGGMLIRKRKS